MINEKGPQTDSIGHFVMRNRNQNTDAKRTHTQTTHDTQSHRIEKYQIAICTPELQG